MANHEEDECLYRNNAEVQIECFICPFSHLCKSNILEIIRNSESEINDQVDTSVQLTKSTLGLAMSRSLRRRENKDKFEN